MNHSIPHSDATKISVSVFGNKKRSWEGSSTGSTSINGLIRSRFDIFWSEFRRCENGIPSLHSQSA